MVKFLLVEVLTKPLNYGLLIAASNRVLFLEIQQELVLLPLVQMDKL